MRLLGTLHTALEHRLSLGGSFWSWSSAGSIMTRTWGRHRFGPHVEPADEHGSRHKGRPPLSSAVVSRRIMSNDLGYLSTGWVR